MLNWFFKLENLDSALANDSPFNHSQMTLAVL